MGLPSLAIKKPVTFSMIFLSILIMGLVSLTRLPVELLPNFSLGYISIFVDIRGGMPPVEVENRVAKIIEDAIGGTTYLKNVLSISEEGRCTVQMQFEPGIDMDLARLEVSERFSRVKKKLPDEIEKPTIQKFEEAQTPIYILAVTGTGYTTEALRKIVDDNIKDHIQRVEGVAKVDVGGGRERKILVEVDQSKLQAYRIPINQVVNKIYFTNLNLLLGDFEKYRYKYVVRSLGEAKTLDDIKNIGVSVTSTGAIIRVKDVADVKDSFLEATSFARVNVMPVVNLYILKESAANTVKVSDGIEKTITSLKTKIDPNIRTITTKNQAEMIKEAIKTVSDSMVQGGILAILVLALFLRSFKPVFVISISIPISVIATFIFMFFGKITMNVMTLSGLAIGIGMLVDNSVVVLENIETKRSQGFDHMRAAILGSEEMVLAIIASTLTTVIVFLPLIFGKTDIKILYGGLALTIVFSIFASLVTAVLLVPMLSARLNVDSLHSLWENKIKKLGVSVGKRFNIWRALYNKSFLMMLMFFTIMIVVTMISYFGVKLPRIYDRVEFYLFNISVFFCAVFLVLYFFRVTNVKKVFTLKMFKKMTFFGIKKRWMLFGIMCVLLCVIAFMGSKLETEFIGSGEQQDFTVFVELPTGAKLSISDDVVKKVEAVLKTVPEIQTFNSRIEPWSSKVYVRLIPTSYRRRSTKEIIESLRPQVEKIQPAFIYFEEPQEIETNEVILDIYGYDYDVLVELADSIAARLNGVPGLTDVKIRHRPGRPEYRVKIDKKKAASFGLSVEEVSNIVHAQMRGLRATYYHTEGKEVEVVVRLDKKFRKNLADIKNLTIITPEGDEILLNQIAEVKQDLGPSKVWRKNKNRMIQVSANRGVLPFGKAVRLMDVALRDLEFPEDYFYKFGEAYDRMIETQNDLRFNLAMVIVLVYLVLASLFESYSQPLLIMMTVPMAAVGVIPVLHLLKLSVNIGVLMGAMMLGGIVVNNAIIMVDHINQLKSIANLSIVRILMKSSSDRLRPILMTSLTTVIGLVPMAMDKSSQAVFWSPLAITVMVGLMCSTMLVLILLPGEYLIMQSVMLFLSDRFKRMDRFGFLKKIIMRKK